MLASTEPIQVFALDHRPILDRYRAICDTMAPAVNDYTQRAGVAHSDPVIVYHLEHNVLAMVRQLTGRPDIKPTYCFLSRYAPGAELRQHVDRSPCHWTVSQTIYCEPAEVAADWHIEIAGCRVGLALGQAVLFRGTILPHARPAMPAHIREYVNCYYHFVPADYDGEML